MREFILSILISYCVIKLAHIAWIALCPVLYKQLTKFNIGNAGNGNLNKFDACGRCRFTILPRHLNPFK